MKSALTKNRLALRSLRFHRKVAFSLVLGIAVAAAVIVGALLVGDSMRGSLQSLTIDRLGRIDQVIIPGGFFATDDIPDQLAARDVIPLIYFNPAIVETSVNDRSSLRRASSVQVLAVDDRFRKLDQLQTLPSLDLKPDEVVLNRVLADELQVAVGDQVTLRLPNEQAVPADSPLGKREAQTEGLPRMKVIDVIASEGLGRFTLQPNQIDPMTAFVSREAVADLLERQGQANALLVSQRLQTDPQDQPADSATEWMNELPFRLSDVGLKLSRVTRAFTPSGGAPQTILDYYQLTSERLLLPGAAVEKLQADGSGKPSQPVMTYLANAIERLNEQGEVTASVPYSIVTAIDDSEQLSLDYAVPNNADGSQPPSDTSVPIVINQWTANALSAGEGDRLRISYYEPEVENGKEIERSFEAVVTSVVALTEPSRPYRRNRPNEFAEAPTRYNDPDLTPTVPGVTDQDSISDWDLPFKLERKISAEDDRYWANHRLTPKAFIPLAAGRTRFGSRFGDTTALRFSSDAAPSLEALESSLIDQLRPLRGELGWEPVRLRDLQLAASKGTTPFDALFLSLSLFVIMAAILLIALLYRLGMLQRSREYGVLLATGWRGQDIFGLALREGLLISLPGVLLGCLGGLVYAWLVLAALRSWWVGAVTVPFLEFHAQPKSFLIGVLSTLAVALLTIWLTARRLRSASAQTLLAGRLEESLAKGPTMSKTWLTWVSPLLLLLSLAALAVGALGSGMAQAGAFVGAGMTLLCACLFWIFSRLRQGSGSRQEKPIANMSAFAASNLRRNPLRSVLAIGLMSVATFLILSMAAFQLRPTQAGIGGFALIGRTATPLYRDLNQSSVRAELLGNDRERLQAAEILSLRLKPGQDASCNNLYQAERPQVWSVPPAIADTTQRVAFDWAAHLPTQESPWTLLESSAAGTETDPIPVILDQNTAMWSLKLGLGSVQSYRWTQGKPIYFRVVALLSNSVLQGSLLISEDNFKRAFPEINGYQTFLINTPQPESVESILENRLGDIGMDVVRSDDVLARLMAVQNTYLKTFQSLGALGLLLGTFGLAVAQLRSVLERQSELAVMRAIGFSKSRLAFTVHLETVGLVALGIGSGLLCAMIAVAPQAILNQTFPPIAQPVAAILLIAVMGMLAGAFAVSRVNRIPLLQAVR